MSKKIPYPGLAMHYYEFPRGTHDGPRAAFVAFYWPDDDLVNLTVLDPHGSTYAVRGVTVVHPGDDMPEKEHYVEFIDEEAKTEDAPDEDDGKIESNIPTGLRVTGTPATNLNALPITQTPPPSAQTAQPVDPANKFRTSPSNA